MIKSVFARNALVAWKALCQAFQKEKDANALKSELFVTRQ